MFTIYKKIISPETSPVLGPATPRESSVVDGSSAQSSSIDIQSPKMQSMPMPPVQSMEPFSLCDCCSTRTKTPQPAQSMQPAQQPEKTDSVYEFNHATHYTYNATTPRMVWEFDINIKPKH
jgi:hypothetical protein